MKILVVGAGAVGGYFGARLAEKGEDVTFLVRERRLQELKTSGLEINSLHGDIHLTPRLIEAGADETFDVIILSTKAYHLEQVLHDIAPFVSEHTYILPLLNGMAHLKQLVDRFGEQRVLGGLCFIESTLDAQGRILQTSPSHHLLFGPLPGTRTDRLEELKLHLTGTAAPINYSDTITRDMWNKYLFITTFSGVTSLFRSSIGLIRSQEEGTAMIHRLATEAKAAMERQGAVFSEEIEQIQQKQIAQMADTMKSSLLRDMEKGSEVESAHLFGTLLSKDDTTQVVLPAIYANLEIYRTSREDV
ncbi:ketopantoate reductase family protein [Exiguobacterium artemiae]|uniref:ketopantoate reductase family protein n=1 Tax=Exiguobacterium artemiae TaxID=340145 RepID=UPI002963D315|nr:ketopantoate reductase family protein [Exiguobacterium sibiricum]MDW2885183.1 ketopantoate reductase family protein [Exiguobacterium sibiricum]